MRLIDADALKEAIESHVTSMSVCLSMDEHYGKVTMREDCLTDIDNASTIEAIPVEWLREWQDEVGTINEWWPIIERIITVWMDEQEAR